MNERKASAETLPRWVIEEGIYAATSHEPLKFYRRIGSNPRWREEWYYAHRTEEFAERMADAGFNHINLAFFKGFGLQEEREEIEDLKARIPIFHKYGIKVRAYIQFGSLMYETFLKEIPDAADWCKRDPQGRPITYRWGDLYWRWRPCANKPEFIAYLKRCIDLAIEIGVDAIGFDNVKQGWGADYADHCYCDTCRTLFRTYLKENFSGREDIIGISTFDFVQPPPVHHREDVICQAWLRFQDERRLAAVRELYRHAKSKKPDVLINTNGLPAHLTSDCTDTATWEGFYWPRLEEDDVVCAAHAYKHGNDRGIFVYASTAPEFGSADGELPDDPKLRTLKLGIARAAAFGGHGVFVPAIGSKMRGARFPLDKPDFAEACRTYFSFLKKYRRHFYPIESLANVAVYLNWPSWNLDRRRVSAVSDLVQQVFLRRHILWDVFYLRPLDDIRKYDLLVLPDIKCMSDAEVEAITEFVAGGGAILSLGETSRYDEHFRERLEPGLGALLGLSSKDMLSALPGGTSASFRKGKAAWLPVPEESLKPGGWWSFRELTEAVSNLLGPHGLPLEVQALDTVIVDAYKVVGVDQLTVSLLNFDPSEKADEVVLRFTRDPFPPGVKALWATPDRASSELQPLPVVADPLGSTITVPEVDIYTMLTCGKDA